MRATKVRSSTKQYLFGVTEGGDSTITRPTKQAPNLSSLMVMVNRQSDSAWESAADGANPTLSIKHGRIIFEAKTVLSFEDVGTLRIGVGLLPLPMPIPLRFGVDLSPRLLRLPPRFRMSRSPLPLLSVGRFGVSPISVSLITGLAQTKRTVRAVRVTRSDALSHHILQYTAQKGVVWC